MAEVPARIDAAWLDAPETRAVIDALGSQNGRFVGGAVRDSLLGRPVTDVDIATPLEPERVIERLEAAGIKVVPTGLKHGTVTAVSNHRPFEVTTLRHDVETFGRHARVAFTDDWQADAARRDFTMNALYADIDGKIYDYFGGIGDAKTGHVRFIGDPKQRIEEDALRILRFYRFHAHYGLGAPDASGGAACAALRDRLDILSVERVRDELLKLLAAPDPVPVLEAMAAAGILVHALPEAGTFDRLSRLVAVEQALGLPDPLRRLAALGRHGTDLDRLGRRLRLSNRRRIRLAAMAGHPPDSDRRSLEEAAYRIGKQAVCDRILLDADPANADRIRTRLATLERFDLPRFPIAGRDLVAVGVPPGPELGQQLERLEERWIRSGFSLDKQALLRKITPVDRR